jgi:uncharacterized membrane protein
MDSCRVRVSVPAETLFVAIGLLSVAIGLPLARRRVPPNRWYGIRLPATFADESVWYDTNAASGRDLMMLGDIVVGVAVIPPQLTTLSAAQYAGLCSGVFVVGSSTMVVRGWRLANRLLRERRAGPPRPR